MRTLGVEEELLLVGPESGRALPVAGGVLDHAARPGGTTGPFSAPPEEGEPAEEEGVESEFQQQQVEIQTHPLEKLAELHADLDAVRARVIQAAREVGARVAAVGTSPHRVEPLTMPKERYRVIRDMYGITAREQLSCGLHVHVAVDSAEEGVAVLDRIRPWLPLLLALSGNSPFWQGQDTGYASFRSQVMGRWPASGAYDLYGSVDAYRRRIDDMVRSGVLLDEGMVYFDARLSSHFPTVEIRSADVCLQSRDAMLIAALSRALVETAAREWTYGEEASQVPTGMLRLATWKAGRYGLDGNLLDPHTLRPRPARDVLRVMLQHLAPALREAGDEDFVRERVEHLLEHGCGAHRQREVYDRTDDLDEVVADVVRLTAGEGD